MTLEHDKEPHNAVPKELGGIDAVRPNSPAAPTIPNRFGIWQLTASFHFPSAMISVLCSDRLPRNMRSDLKRLVRKRSRGYSKDQAAVFDRLAEAEGRLRLAFALGQPFSLLPIYNQPASAEQISPTLRRQSISLVAAEPFNWLSPQMSTSFSFRSLGATAFFNEFSLRPNDVCESELSHALDTALFDVAAIIADRRSHMLAQGLAERTYTIFLPAEIINDVAAPSRNYILIPVLSFIRLSNKGCFRRTFSLSLVLIPVSRGENASRCLDPDELAALQTGWTLIPRPGIASYCVPAGGLSSFIARLSTPLNRPSESIITLRELIEDILFAAANNAV